MCYQKEKPNNFDVNKLEYNNTQRHSKPMLPNILNPSKLQLSMDF